MIIHVVEMKPLVLGHYVALSKVVLPSASLVISAGRFQDTLSVSRPVSAEIDRIDNAHGA